MTIPISNAKRRKDLLILTTMVASASELGDRADFKTMHVQSTFAKMIQLVHAHKVAVPVDRERSAEQQRTKMVVNTVLSAGFSYFPPEVKLWLAARLVQSLIGMGWRPDRSAVATDFVQALYGLAQNFPKFEPPRKDVQDLAIMLPEMFRAIGYFK